MNSLGRGALTLAIEAENLEMVELLVVMGVETKDALLHAIDQEFVEAVELLLEHEELLTANQIMEDDSESKSIHRREHNILIVSTSYDCTCKTNNELYTKRTLCI